MRRGEEGIPKASMQDGIESNCWEGSVVPFMMGGCIGRGDGMCAELRGASGGQNVAMLCCAISMSYAVCSMQYVVQKVV